MHNMKNNIIIALAVLGFSSCGVYSNFSTPETQIAEVYGDEVKLNADDSTYVLSWGETFADPVLKGLIEKALSANVDFAVARLNIEQSEAMLVSSKLSYLPSFMLSPQGSVGSFGGSTSKSYSLPLTASWEIDIFGKIRNSKEQTKAIVEQSKEYSQMVQIQLISGVANGYYTLVMLDEQLRIAKETVLNLKKSVETIVALKEAGLQTEAGVQQSTAAYYEVQLSVEELSKQISNTENSLSLLLNQTPQTIERSKFDYQTLSIDITEGIPLLALSNRPDVRHSEMVLKHSFYGINVARSAFYPSLVLGGSVGWTNNLGAIVNPGKMLLSVMGSLTQPLFNAGVNRANLKIAKATYEQSLLAFQYSLLKAGNEVNDALIQCKTSSNKAEFRQKQVVSLQKAVEVTQELMTNGNSIYLEVLTAQNTLLQARLHQVSDWFGYIQGQISLYKTLGGK